MSVHSQKHQRYGEDTDTLRPRNIGQSSFGRSVRSILVIAPYLSRKFSGTAHVAINTINALARSTETEIHVATFLVDDGVIPADIQVSLLAHRPERRGVWRIGRAFALDDCESVLLAASLPVVDMMFTQSLEMAAAYAKLFPDTHIVSHLGHVIGSREALLDSSLGWPWKQVDAYLSNVHEALFYNLPNLTHVVSTQLVAEQRSRHFKIAASTFHVQPLGIETHQFSDRSARDRTRERIGIDPSGCLIVTVSRLVKWKNTAWLIRAMRKLPGNVHLAIVGDGPEKAALTESVDAQICDRVHVIGHDTPVDWLAAGDIFALPSQIESFGMAYAEAMCMGLPCIGLRNSPPAVLSSAQDVICPGPGGIVVSDEQELVEALRVLVSDPKRRREMGAYSSAWAMRHYTQERYAKFLEQRLAATISARAATQARTYVVRE